MVSRNSFQRALTAHQTGNHKKAGAICDNILKRQPGDFDALHLRGLVAFETNNRQEAIRFIEKSLEINPSQPSALNNIGNIHRKIGNLEKARDVYRRALRLQPEFPDAWSNLSIIYHDMDKMDEALDMVQSALKIDPDHAIANHTLGFLLMENNDMEGAAKAFERCTKSKPPKNLTPIWYAKILINFDMLVEAERMLIRWLKQYPGDEVALHYIDAIRGNESSRTSELAVRGTFDNFAASFDKVLLGNLDYRAPQLVGEAVHQTYNNEKCLRIADLGCGTGLMAPMLAPLAEMLVGIDLSDKMLQKARSRGGYHELVNDDLVKYLNGMGEGSFDLVTCVDTLCYFGELSETFDAVFRVLVKGGHFIATTEQAEPGDAPYSLDLTGRFRHQIGYVEAAVGQAGLELLKTEKVVLRKEAGKPVNGLLITALRS